MNWERVLADAEQSRETREGLRLLRQAAQDDEATGYLNHGSNTTNVLTYFAALRAEAHDLLCGNSKRYAQERKTLDRSGVAAVAFLAGTLTAQFGAPAALATPLAAAALYIPLKMGVGAWCRLYVLSPRDVTPQEIALTQRPAAPKRRG